MSEVMKELGYWNITPIILVQLVYHQTVLPLLTVLLQNCLLERAVKSFNAADVMLSFRGDVLLQGTHKRFYWSS